MLGDRAGDAADVLDEAHVEHAIGFVEDEERHAAELHVAALDQVEQAAGRGDQDVDATRQGLDLAAVAHAADDGAEAQAEAAAVGVEAARDLDGKLAGRREDERARALGLGAFAGSGEVLQHGQREGRRLAGAGLGDAQNVTALQQRRDGARLDRRGHGVAGGVQGTQQRLGQAEIRKRNITHWENSPYRPARDGSSGFWLTLRRGGGRLFLLGDCLGMKRRHKGMGRVAQSRETLIDPQCRGLRRI